MDREKFTEKLVRMIDTIASGALPVRVREFYVFGSYARGALEPDDLDVLVVHDAPSSEYLEAVIRSLAGKGNPTEIAIKTGGKIESEIRRPLRKPGERIEIILAKDVDRVTGAGSKIKPDDLVFLWSETDREYLSKLAAILPDAAAGRAPRDHLFPLKRLYDDIGSMDRTVAMVNAGELAFTKIPIDGIECRLNVEHARLLERWTMGKDSLRILPYALWWFEQHRQKAGFPDQGEVWSTSRTHRAHLGRPSLGSMVSNFRCAPKLKRQCLIPHIKKGQPNELLVFERGVNWSPRESPGKVKSSFSPPF